MAKELNENTSFKVSIQTLIGIGFAMATIIGMWFALQADIQEAIRVLKDEVLFVGLQHRWEDSINTFHTLFGGPLYPEELLTFRANTKNRVKIQAERVVQRYTYDDKDERVYKVAENRLKGMMTEIQRDSEKLI